MDVPILGQPATFMHWYPTVMLRCNCIQDRISLVVLKNFHEAVICGNCKKGYTCKGILPNGNPDVVMFMPTPEGSVM
jgi:hypothetical protein